MVVFIKTSQGPSIVSKSPTPKSTACSHETRIDIKSRVVRNNLVTPEIFVSEIWMQEDYKNGVEITELNSSNSEAGEPQTANNFSQAWSFINNDRFRDTKEDYIINETARERRRKKNEDIAYANEYLHDHDTQTNFNGFHCINVDSDSSGAPANHQMNCFTIINKHVIDSNSSSDNDCARVEEMEPFYTENNEKYWDHVYNENKEAYNPNNSSEKRTVWIYSFKNQRRLSENDFELVNIPSRDSGTSTSKSSTDEDMIDKSTNVFRIASPIPATFVPRLDLAQTLSTVTEISEVKNSEESSNESLIIKPINNWLTERNQKSKNISSIVNWMALSPRERRRRFKNTNSDMEHENRRETFTYAEGDTDKSRMISSVIQVDVEVHTNGIASPGKLAETASIDLEVEKKKVANTLSINISYADADTEVNFENENVVLNPSSKPNIQLSRDRTYYITEPIEKLDSTKWIVEDQLENETSTFYYEPVGIENNSMKIEGVSKDGMNGRNSVSERLWMKSAKLMKSPMWAEYLPITESPPSIHLSLSLSSINDKKPWFKRIIKYLKCCK